MQIEIPSTKITEFITQLKSIEGREAMTKRQLQSIIGSMNHLAKAVKPARVFMNRLLDALHATDDGPIPIGHQAKADLGWFVMFLEQYNGRSLIITGDPVMTIDADSCLQGGRATKGTDCYMYRYPPTFQHTYHHPIRGPELPDSSQGLRRGAT